MRNQKEHPFGGSHTAAACSPALRVLLLDRERTQELIKMRPGSVFGLTTLGLVSRTSMDDRLGDGPPLWEGEQQFHAFLGYALLTAMAAACAHSVSHSSRRWRH